MKSDNKKLREYISRYVKRYLAEAEEEKPADDAKEEAPAEEEENPFAAGDEGGDEGGDAKGGDEKGGEKKPEQPTGIPLQFDISKVKQYNKSNFLSDKGVVKSIDKRGIVVTTQPDNVDVLVNFDDITENVKTFFKKKK